MFGNGRRLAMQRRRSLFWQFAPDPTSFVGFCRATARADQRGFRRDQRCRIEPQRQEHGPQSRCFRLGKSNSVHAYLASDCERARGGGGPAQRPASILDELGQVDPKEAGEIAYMLSNERGKTRARRDGLARQAATWRLLFVSSGEVGLADKLGEIGKKARAGQEVRLVDVPADAGLGMGPFEELHGSEKAEAFAGRLKDAAIRQHHGSAAVAYLEVLASRLAIDADGLRRRIVATVEEFLVIYAPAHSSGQALSVARRFGVIAAGGQIATGCGLTGWAEDAAFEAAGACFRAWLDRRGGAGEQETASAISQVRAFLEAHGDARFADIENSGARVVPNRAGWRRVRGDETEFLIPPET
jgi:putative DNA primase/helicase